MSVGLHIPVHRVSAWCPGDQQKPRNWSYRRLWTTWQRGINPGSSERAASVLRAEPSLQCLFTYNFCISSLRYFLLVPVVSYKKPLPLELSSVYKLLFHFSAGKNFPWLRGLIMTGPLDFSWVDICVVHPGSQLHSFMSTVKFAAFLAKIPSIASSVFLLMC